VIHGDTADIAPLQLIEESGGGGSARAAMILFNALALTPDEQMDLRGVSRRAS